MSIDLTGFQPGGRTPAPAPLDLVQDFVNTEIPEWARDDISTPAELTAWLRERALLAGEEEVDAAGFVTARALRGLVRELALLNTLGAEPDASLRDRFDRTVADARLVVELDPDGAMRLAPADAGAERALATILAHVVEAQASGAWSRLKACRKEHCGWLFYDGSRNASSTWCSMSICGNRSKTAAYRGRRRTP